MRRKLSIPTSFKLNGKIVTVEYDNDYCNEEKLFGEADFTDKKITLCNLDKRKGRSPKKITMKKQVETFYHELAHMLLDAADRHNLKYNEALVDRLGELIQEYERTKK